MSESLSSKFLEFIHKFLEVPIIPSRRAMTPQKRTYESNRSLRYFQSWFLRARLPRKRV